MIIHAAYASNLPVKWNAQNLLPLADKRLWVEQAKLTHDIFVAMNDPTARDHLHADNEAWRDRPAVPLDPPWPDVSQKGDLTHLTA